MYINNKVNNSQFNSNDHIHLRNQLVNISLIIIFE